MFTHGVGDLIIFSGGRTAGLEYPSEAEAMRDSMRSHERFSGLAVPDEAIRLEEESSSTAGNLEEVKARLSEFDVDDVILLTVGYHIPRTILQARQAGLPVRGYARSDYVIRGHHGGEDHLYARRVLDRSISGQRFDWHPALRAGVSYGMEGLAWGSLVAGPLGRRLGGLATDKMRHQE